MASRGGGDERGVQKRKRGKDLLLACSGIAYLPGVDELRDLALAKVFCRVRLGDAFYCISFVTVVMGEA